MSGKTKRLVHRHIGSRYLFYVGSAKEVIFLTNIYVTDRSLNGGGMLDFVEDDFVGIKSH